MPTPKEKHIQLANDKLLTNGNLDVVDQFFSIDYVAHAGDKRYKGHAFIRRFVKQLRAVIPNLRVVDVAILSQSRDSIAWQRTLAGTHKTALKGIPASGRKVKWQEMFVTRFADGKIAEEWMVSDLAGQLMLKLPPR